MRESAGKYSNIVFQDAKKNYLTLLQQGENFILLIDSMNHIAFVYIKIVFLCPWIFYETGDICSKAEPCQSWNVFWEIQ